LGSIPAPEQLALGEGMMERLLIGLILLLELGCRSATHPAAGGDSSASAASIANASGEAGDIYMPVYKPRKYAAAQGRVDGGFRGGKEGEPVLKVLAPYDHVGETLHKSPALYWYVSQPTQLPIDFTLEDSREWEPVLRVTLNPPTKPGIQVIRLSDYNASLEPEVTYQWHVSIKISSESPSKDIHAMGVIERAPYVQAIAEGRTTCGDPRDVFCLYVDMGFWYDAIQVISDLIAANPRDRVLRLQRAALLEKAGLADIAQFDRKQTAKP
jgi:hypothetical protein